MTSRLRVGYVPEHFSLPILELAKSAWGQENIELVSQPSGTGQMLTSFNAESPEKRQIDVAIALTEALVAGIGKGRKDYGLTGTYVKSSLNWAVITGTDKKASHYNSIDDLRGSKIGISRIGSGSQIMASVMALQHGWTGKDGSVQEIEFKGEYSSITAGLMCDIETSSMAVNDTFANLRKGVNQVEGFETSAFMWEWYTTKPFVDSGEVRFIGNVPTPWPSWTIAYSKSISSDLQKILSEFQRRLQETIKDFTAADNEEKSLEAIKEQMSYKGEDVRSWWSGVRWVQDQREDLGAAARMKGQETSTTTVSKGVLEQTLSVLEKAGVLQRPADGWDHSTFASADKLVE